MCSQQLAASFGALASAMQLVFQRSAPESASQNPPRRWYFPPFLSPLTRFGHRRRLLSLLSVEEYRVYLIRHQVSRGAIVRKARFEPRWRPRACHKEIADPAAWAAVVLFDQAVPRR